MSRHRDFLIALAIGMFLFIIFIFAMLESPEEEAKHANDIDSWAILREANAKKQTSTSCDGCLAINQDTFGCASKAAFDRVLMYIAQGDKQAAATAVSLGCTILSKGTLVYTENYEFLSGETQVRPQGSTQALWVMSQTVSK